jgi:hypothetical protein
MEWWSIEVFDGGVLAAHWMDAHGTSLVEAAITHGALDWAWHQHRFGVVFEVAFRDDAAWEQFSLLPAVVAALDSVPDRLNGLLVYRGRGGTSSSPIPRRPRPLAGAGAMALPEPLPDLRFVAHRAVALVG